MPRPLFLIAAIALVCAQNACYTMGHLELIPATEGKSRRFPGDAEKVASATRKAIAADDLHLTSETKLAGGHWRFLAQKYPSLNDYGSIVRILVESDTAGPDTSTLVRVVTRPRGALNVTAVHDFSNSLFHHIDLALLTTPPGVIAALPGSALRLHFAGGQVVQGRLRSATADTIVLAYDTTMSPTPFAVTTIRGIDIEMSPTERRRRRQRAAVVGGLLGSLGGALIGAAIPVEKQCAPTEIFCVETSGIQQSANMLVGSVVGGLLGIAIGHATSSSSSPWMPMPMPTNVTFTPGKGAALEVRMSARF